MAATAAWLRPLPREQPGGQGAIVNLPELAEAFARLAPGLAAAP
jgi:hypothetical protein